MLFDLESLLNAVRSNQLTSFNASDFFTTPFRRGEASATLEGHLFFVIALAVLPDGSLVSGSEDSTIKHWDIKTGQCLRTLEGHSNFVWALAVLPDGSLVGGSNDNTIKHWSFSQSPVLLSYRDIAPLLAALIEHPHDIEQLSLRGVVLGPEGYQQVSKLVETSNTLMELNLEETGLGEKEKSRLSRLCRRRGIALNCEGIIEPHSLPYTFLSSYVPTAATAPISDLGATTIPEVYHCPITLELMFNPVFAADGHTYEEEAIEAHFAQGALAAVPDSGKKTDSTSSTATKALRSPKTNDELPHSFLIPNHSLRGQILSFLDEYPESWEAVYFSRKLVNELAAACQDIDSARLGRVLQRDPRLMTRPVLGSYTLLEGLCHQNDLCFESLFPFVINQFLTTRHCTVLMTQKPLSEWLVLVASKNHIDITAAFIKKVSERLEIKITPLDIALLGLEQNNLPLMQLALREAPDLLTQLFEGGNTLLHLAAQQGKTELVRCLIEQGANIKQRNQAGLKPEALATAAGHSAIANVIAERKIAPVLERLGMMGMMSRLRELEDLVAQQRQAPLGL